MPITNLKSGDLTSRKSVGNQRGVIWAHPGNRGVNGYIGPWWGCVRRSLGGWRRAAEKKMSRKWRPGDALARAERRRPPWRIVAIALGLTCAIGVFLFGSNLTLRAQIFLGPDHVFFCTPTHLSAIILFLALGVLSIPIGFIIANLLLSMAPSIRSDLERAEARAGGSFATANAGLVKFTCVSVLVFLPVYTATVGAKICLSDSQIYYQSYLLAPLQTYDMSQITEVRPRCAKGGRGGWDIGLDIALSDGTSFDLAVVGPWFSASSEGILASLRGVRSNDSQIESGCPIGLRKLVSP